MVASIAISLPRARRFARKPDSAPKRPLNKKDCARNGKPRRSLLLKRLAAWKNCGGANLPRSRPRNRPRRIPLWNVYAKPRCSVNCGLACTFQSGILRGRLRGLLRGKFAPPQFFQAASRFSSRLRLGFPLRAQSFLFNGLFGALPGFLANLRAQRGEEEIANLATMQIRPGI